MTIEFTVPGKPVPMARPRVTMHGTYTPARCREYKALVSSIARQAMLRHKPIAGPVIIYIRFRFAIPKSWSKTKRQEWENGNVHHLSRPDIDNLYKAITDALIGIVYNDDSQIVAAQIMKSYEGVDEVAVTLMEAGQDATGHETTDEVSD